MGIIVVLLVGAVVYLLLTRNNGGDNLKPTDNTEEKEDNKNNIQKELEKVNEKVFELLSPGKTLDEFKKQATNYFTDDVINELAKYYDKNTESICLDTAACGVGGGFLLEVTDIDYRKLEIVDIKDDIIVANGIYGEAEDNISGKTEITYKKVNGVWKISEYNLKNNNEGNPSDNKEEKTNVPDKAVAYNNNSGKIIYLLEIANEKKNTGLDPHTYELYENGNKIKVYSYYENSKFVVSNDNNWYYLDKANKKIVSFYSSKSKVAYNRNGKSDDKQEWYIIFDNTKIVQIVNDTKGTVLSFNSNNPDDYIIENEKIYLKFNNKIMKYDANGKVIDTKTYDKILYFGDYNVRQLIVLKNKNYYNVNLETMKEVSVNKVSTYKGNNKNLEIYLLVPKTSENDNIYMVVYDGKYYTSSNINGEFKDSSYDYGNIFVDRIEGAAQNYAGSFLINRKTNEVIEYNDFSYVDISKVSGGYYFGYIGFSESDSPYSDDVKASDVVKTSNGKKLVGNGFYSVVGDNIVLENNNSLIKYDINGNVISTISCNDIYLIENNYSLVSIENAYYVINLTTFEKKKVNLPINNADNLIYGVDDKEIRYYNDKEYIYNYITGDVKAIY